MGQTSGEIARRRRSSADARPGSTSRDAGLAKIMPGRKARFAGKDPHCQSANAGQSGSAWPVSPSARPVPTSSGKQRPLRKSIVERFAVLTRESREKKPIRLPMKLTTSHASLSSHLVTNEEQILPLEQIAIFFLIDVCSFRRTVDR